MEAHQLHDAKPVIWIVDDDPIFRDAMAQCLRALRYNVVEFSDSITALQHEESGAPVHLLIADIILAPGQPHGAALAAMMRNRRARLPCITVTGSAEVAQRSVGRLAGNERLMLKPVNLDALAREVGVLLGQR